MTFLFVAFFFLVVSVAIRENKIKIKNKNDATTASSSMMMKECDVLHDDQYTIGSWKWTKSPRAWQYCYDTVSSLNVLHQNLFCHGGHGTKVVTALPPLEWMPKNCTLRRFSSERFVNALRAHRVAFVGDSVTAQQYFNLRCFLEQGISFFFF